MVWNVSGSTVYFASRSNTVRSAGWPSASSVPKPNRRFGAPCIKSTSFSREMSPGRTRWV